MNKLEEARSYEKKWVGKQASHPRPAFHVTPPVGWMNDPNGFSLYRGEYHLFYQYYPYDVHWGPMYWGHVKTSDFMEWEWLPAALAPDEPYETGCFSGGAVELADGRQLLLYTSHFEEKDEKTGETVRREAQSVAIGDGMDYEKAKANPVITARDLPEEFSGEDFRDPKIWREKDGFYAVAVSMSGTRGGSALLFSSADGLAWEFVTVLESSYGKCGKMWECPDFFALGEKQVMIVSPMEMFAEGLEFHNGHGVVSIIGTYDGEEHRFTREQIKSLEYGFDFYAPQTLETGDGRRVMIGWMQTWDNYMTPEGFSWSGMMSVPRELFFRDGALCQLPVREIENRYTDAAVHRDAALCAGKKRSFDDVRGRVLDMTVTVESGDYRRFTVNLAEKDPLRTAITYDRAENTVTFCRRFGGLTGDILDTRSFLVEDRLGAITLRVVMDRYSVELFTNGGAQAFTSLIYTDQEADGISFETDGELVFHVEKHGIEG